MATYVFENDEGYKFYIEAKSIKEALIMLHDMYVIRTFTYVGRKGEPQRNTPKRVQK